MELFPAGSSGIDFDHITFQHMTHLTQIGRGQYRWLIVVP